MSISPLRCVFGRCPEWTISQSYLGRGFDFSVPRAFSGAPFRVRQSSGPFDINTMSVNCGVHDVRAQCRRAHSSITTKSGFHSQDCQGNAPLPPPHSHCLISNSQTRPLISWRSFRTISTRGCLLVLDPWSPGSSFIGFVPWIRSVCIPRQHNHTRPSLLAAMPDLGSIARGRKRKDMTMSSTRCVSRGSLGSWPLFCL